MLFWFFEQWYCFFYKKIYNISKRSTFTFWKNRYHISKIIFKKIGITLKKTGIPFQKEVSKRKKQLSQFKKHISYFNNKWCTFTHFVTENLKNSKNMELCLDVGSSLKQICVPSQIFDRVAHILYIYTNVQIFGIFWKLTDIY